MEIYGVDCGINLIKRSHLGKPESASKPGKRIIDLPPKHLAINAGSDGKTEPERPP